MNAIAIIPARGGSTRIPRKNIRPFYGKPIIVYSIEAAIRSGLFSAGVWVSTEDPEIARVAWDAGAKVHPRTEALARNEVGTQEVMRAALCELFPGEATRPESACCIYATAPLMTFIDLRVGFSKLELGPTHYIYSVDGLGQDAGQWYWGRTQSFIDGVLLATGGLGHVLPDERVCDINTLDDWIRAERMYAALHSRCRSPSGACDQWTCTLNGKCAWEGAQ